MDDSIYGLNKKRRPFMKKTILLAVLLIIFAVSSNALAERKRDGMVSVKVDYISFNNSTLKDSDVDSGVYFGLENYLPMTQHFFLGNEIGYAKTTGTVSILGANTDTEVKYVPVELNLKYVAEPASHITFDLGVGISFNHVMTKLKSATALSTGNEWVFGGQVFADINYRAESFFFGLDGRYQYTDDVDEGGYDYTNWRAGAHAGFYY